MNYYRVKPEYDQKQRIKNHKYIIKRKPDGIFVANELYTAGELEKFYLTPAQDNWFEHVVIPKNKVYWCFGCRFAMDDVSSKEKEAEAVMNHYDEGCKKWSELFASGK